MRFDYEAEYRRLREAGSPGWAVRQETERSSRLFDTLSRLQRTGVFPAPPAPLLELGCGNGRIALAMARHGYEVCGVDIAVTAVEWARERFAEAGLAGRFHANNVCAMPFLEAETFGIAIDGQCLHCLIGEDRGGCLAEVRRLLRPGGVFFVSSMVAPPKSEEARARFDPERGYLLREGVPYRTLKSMPDLAAELSYAGFEIEEHDLGVNPWWDHVMMLCRKS